MYHIMCVEHVCTLYTYPIRMYCATIYKNMEFVVFCNRYIKLKTRRQTETKIRCRKVVPYDTNVCHQFELISSGRRASATNTISRHCVYHFDTIQSSSPHYATKFFIRYVPCVLFRIWCTDIVRLLLYSTLLFANFLNLSHFSVFFVVLLLPVCRCLNEVILRLRFVIIIIIIIIIIPGATTHVGS